jgi:metal-responsive CopG/Arc/MetJ family transcriptional regulator
MSNYRTINISLPDNLLKKVDAEAKSEFANRSDFIRDTLVRRLKHQRVVDEWGDDGEWETVVDLRSINPNGVPLDDVLKSIGKLTK